MTQLYTTGNAQFGVNPKIGGASFLKNIKNLVKKTGIVKIAGAELLKRIPVEHQALASQVIDVASKAAADQGFGVKRGKKGGKPVKAIRDLNRFLNKTTKAVSKFGTTVLPIALGMGKKKRGRPRKMMIK